MQTAPSQTSATSAAIAAQSGEREHACLPCSKRKVRCDKQLPCSNCKRRTQDVCVYPSTALLDRIAQLESLVRSLGGDPDRDIGSGLNARPRLSHHHSTSLSPPNNLSVPEIDTGSSPSSSTKRGSVGGGEQPVVKLDGQPLYLDSDHWDGWSVNTTPVSNTRTPVQPSDNSLAARLGFNNAPALNGVLHNDMPEDWLRMHPKPSCAKVMWDVYLRNVHPVLKFTMDRDLKIIQSATEDENTLSRLQPAEHTLCMAIYMSAIHSLPEDDVVLQFYGQTRTAALERYQSRCERGLVVSNLMGSTDLRIIQAVILYFVSTIDRLELQSLWSLMGAVLRNAERIGLHRDGTFTGLSPYKTELHRRVWWALQCIDFSFGVRCGAMSMSILGDWDTQLPMNIEDSDLTPEMTTYPVERKGITAMSTVMWQYWFIREHRKFRKNDTSMNFAWMLTSNMAASSKHSYVDILRDGLNFEFLQFCDPLQPGDMFIQIGVRNLVSCLRRFTLQSCMYYAGAANADKHIFQDLLETCRQCLRYNIAMHKSELLKNFEWRLYDFFQWGALIFILTKLSQHMASLDSEQDWLLVAELYTANRSLTDFRYDQRKLRAVQLMLDTWKRYEHFTSTEPQSFGGVGGTMMPSLCMQKPECFVDLEKKVDTLLYETRLSREYPYNTQSFYLQADQGRPYYLNMNTNHDAGQIQLGLGDQIPQSTASRRGSSPRKRKYEGQAFDGDIDFAQMFFKDIDWSFWDPGPGEFPALPGADLVM